MPDLAAKALYSSMYLLRQTNVPLDKISDRTGDGIQRNECLAKPALLLERSDDAVDVRRRALVAVLEALVPLRPPAHDALHLKHRGDPLLERVDLLGEVALRVEDGRHLLDCEGGGGDVRQRVVDVEAAPSRRCGPRRRLQDCEALRLARRG